VLIIFDKEIKTRTHSCQFNDEQIHPIKPYINLYIRLTNNCQANCKFCEYHSGSRQKFDLEKFVKVLLHLRSNKIRINKINFTGGEPALYMDTLADIYNVIKKIYSHVELTINTNGFRINEIFDNFNFEYYALSRHHYDDDKNKEIFGANVPSFDEIKKYSERDNIHLRCNLIKGYIDSKEEIITYIEKFSNIGVMDFGFVSLMQLNKYCVDNFIDYNVTQFNTIENMKLNFQQKTTGCNCKNYLYFTKNGNVVQLYSRFNEDFTNQYNTLVFDVDKLTSGFGGEVII